MQHLCSNLNTGYGTIKKTNLKWQHPKASAVLFSNEKVQEFSKKKHIHFSATTSAEWGYALLPVAEWLDLPYSYQLWDCNQSLHKKGIQHSFSVQLFRCLHKIPYMCLMSLQKHHKSDKLSSQKDTLAIENIFGKQQIYVEFLHIRVLQKTL